MKEALLVIDMQYDFLPGGALEVEYGDQIIKPIIALMPKFDTIVFTQDWHPRGHKSFASSHPGKNPGDVITMHGHDQVLWPDHCVQRTHGACIHDSFPMEMADVILRKGTNPEVDSYSAFHENWSSNSKSVSFHRNATGLLGFFLERVVRQITIVGLARRVCVRWSAEDSGMVIPTRVIWDLTRDIEPSPEADEQTVADLKKQNVEIV